MPNITYCFDRHSSTEHGYGYTREHRAGSLEEDPAKTGESKLFSPKSVFPHVPAGSRNADPAPYAKYNLLL
jgi:hypothetical protein